MLLSIVTWFLIGLYILSAAAGILLIGKPREPYSPASALVGVIMSLVAIAVLLSLLRTAGL